MRIEVWQTKGIKESRDLANAIEEAGGTVVSFTHEFRLDVYSPLVQHAVSNHFVWARVNDTVEVEIQKFWDDGNTTGSEEIC